MTPIGIIPPNTPPEMTRAPEWVAVTDHLPPNGVVVNTKIDDGGGCRNVQELKRQDRLWFTPDGQMYVYYTPTHWSA